MDLKLGHKNVNFMYTIFMYYVYHVFMAQGNNYTNQTRFIYIRLIHRKINQRQNQTVLRQPFICIYLGKCLAYDSVLNMKAVVGAFNQESILVEALFVIVISSRTFV